MGVISFKKRTGYYVPNDGVITKLNAALNPLKISIETFGNINSKYYKYEIDITAVKEEYKATNPATEYKLIYSYGEPYLYKKTKDIGQN